MSEEEAQHLRRLVAELMDKCDHLERNQKLHTAAIRRLQTATTAALRNGLDLIEKVHQNSKVVTAFKRFMGPTGLVN